ncbi:family S53 protease-like protein [Mycena galopus ATCC 62051]|nr:family S53 protease-like protein [Mycena galopus ATCC 62051]
MVVIESRSAAPNGFVSRGAAPASDVLTLRFALASNNLAGLEAKLMSAATPGSSKFRQWLSMDEVKSFVQPSAETVAAFDTFASTNGLKPTVISPNGDWVSLTLPVSQANELFVANFQVFTHPAMTGTITRTLSVSLPPELVGHVDVVHPTTAFLNPNPPLASVTKSTLETRDISASCNTSDASGVITPSCLQEIYGIPTAPATEASNTLLVTGYDGEFPQSADLTTFLTLLRPDISSNTTFTFSTLDGGVNASRGDVLSIVEANLDIQYTIGVATEVPTQFLSVGGSDLNSTDFVTSLLDTTAFLDGVANPPSVVTTSYATTESSIGAGLATKLCNSYMALGSRGISVLFASGDGGVRGNQDYSEICDDNVFMPTFPAACPFVTAVGSTLGFAPEVAVNFTGGGFSNLFPAPTYQTTAVAGFLDTIPSDFAGTFNQSGCGYPDVAVQGWNFEIIINNRTGLIQGTSASTPTFASMIALINDRLVAAGKPVLGFLNPFIYSTVSAFNDITSGHNSGAECPASSVAFDATVGWDPLTGVGSPRFSDLLSAALN